MKAIIFGTGYQYELHKRMIMADFSIAGIVDNDSNKWGKVIDGFEIEKVDSILEKTYDVIVIAMQLENSLRVKKQLEEMGIPESKMRFYSPCGIKPYRVPEEFFYQSLSVDEKKRLFSNNVQRVIAEINSKCNRQCWYCPNSFVDRHSKNVEMEDEIYNKILNQLKEINYRNELTFSYFNEPLTSTKILDRIRDGKKMLPNVHTYIFTNGDYLNQEMLLKLSEAGLDSLRVDLYPDNEPGEYTRRAALELVNDFLKKNSLSPNYQLPLDDVSPACIVARAKIGNMEIEFNTRDFTVEAKNRAEAMPEDLPIPKVTERNRPCLKSFMSFHIAYNGNVYPCPNMHSEVPKHQEYCVGNVKDDSIFDIFSGEKLNAFREKNLFHRDTLPCRSCSWYFTSFIENRYNRPFKNVQD